MKPLDALEVYKIIMSKYDKLLPAALTPAEYNESKQTFVPIVLDLEKTKKRLEILATETAPTSASGESARFGDVSADEKIMNASREAFIIASTSEHVKAVQDCEQYIETFKQAYDAALRVELYRQFIGQNQDIEALKLKFIKEKNTVPNLKSLMDFLFDDITKNIKSEFSKFEKVQGSLTPDESNVIDSMREKLEGFLKTFKEAIDENVSTNSLDPKNKSKAILEASLQFQIAAGQLIRGEQIKAESNESWAPFRNNMLMLATGVGMIPAIISLLTKAVTGKYMFFDNPVIRKTTEEEMSPEDKLLNGPKAN